MDGVHSGFRVGSSCQCGLLRCEAPSFCVWVAWIGAGVSSQGPTKAPRLDDATCVAPTQEIEGSTGIGAGLGVFYKGPLSLHSCGACYWTPKLCLYGGKQHHRPRRPGTGSTFSSDGQFNGSAAQPLALPSMEEGCTLPGQLRRAPVHGFF
jgi:hypothetical protein